MLAMNKFPNNRRRIRVIIPPPPPKKTFVIEAQFEIWCSLRDANDDCYPLECDAV